MDQVERRGKAVRDIKSSISESLEVWISRWELHMAWNGNGRGRSGLLAKKTWIFSGQWWCDLLVYRKIILVESRKWFGRQRQTILSIHYMLNKWMEFNVYCSIRSTGLWALISQQDRCGKGPVSRILQLEGDETWTSAGSSGFGKNGWVCGVLRR